METYIKDFFRKDAAKRAVVDAIASVTVADLRATNPPPPLAPDDVLPAWVISARMLGLDEKQREVRGDWAAANGPSVADLTARDLLEQHTRRIRVLESQCVVGPAGILVLEALEQAKRFGWPLWSSEETPRTREQREDARLALFIKLGGRVEFDRKGKPRFFGIAKLANAEEGEDGSNESTLRKDLTAAYNRQEAARRDGSAGVAEPAAAWSLPWPSSSRR